MIQTLSIDGELTLLVACRSAYAHRMRITMFCLNTVAKVEVESSSLSGSKSKRWRLAAKIARNEVSKRRLHQNWGTWRCVLRFDLLSARFGATLAHPCRCPV